MPCPDPQTYTQDSLYGESILRPMFNDWLDAKTLKTENERLRAIVADQALQIAELKNTGGLIQIPTVVEVRDLEQRQARKAGR